MAQAGICSSPRKVKAAHLHLRFCRYPLRSVIASRRGYWKALSEMFQAQNLLCNLIRSLDLGSNHTPTSGRKLQLSFVFRRAQLIPLIEVL